MESPKSLSERQIVIITTRPKPGAAVDWEVEFRAAPKAPAGEVSGEPEFRLYLGVNSGGYATAPNGSLILPPVPIEWIIAPLNVTDGQCHTASENLTLFGATNLLAMALILLTGCRPLMRFLTRGLLGRPGRYSVFWTWIFAFGLQIGSNAVVSHLIVSTPGYEHLSMLNVFALYSSRPRVNQIWTGVLRQLVGGVYLRGKLAWLAPKPGGAILPRFDLLKKKSPGDTILPSFNAAVLKKKSTGAEKHASAEGRDAANPEEKLPGALKRSQRCIEERRLQQTPARSPKPRPPALGSDPSVPEWVYTDAYRATSVAEFALQLASAIFVGVTWRRFPNAPIREHMSSYVNYMLAAPALALVGWVALPVWTPRNTLRWVFKGGEGEHYRWRHDAPRGGPVTCLWQLLAVTSVHFVILLPFLAFTGFFTYGVAWRYWAEFLTLPGSLWCPPKFVEEAAVWSTFSALSAAISGL